jgi:hypothetical protein
MTMEEADRLRRKFAPYVQQVTSVCEDKRRAATAKRYLAQVPLLAQPGDVICIVLGAAIPFLIRLRESGYQLVSECYVYRLMKGEALEMAELHIEDVIIL